MTNNWDSLALRAFEAKKQRQYYQELEEKLMSSLKMASGFKTTIGDRFMLVRETRKGNIQYQSIPELVNVDLDRYRKPDVEIFKLNMK